MWSMKVLGTVGQKHSSRYRENRRTETKFVEDRLVVVVEVSVIDQETLNEVGLPDILLLGLLQLSRVSNVCKCVVL